MRESISYTPHLIKKKKKSYHYFATFKELMALDTEHQ